MRKYKSEKDITIKDTYKKFDNFMIDIPHSKIVTSKTSTSLNNKYDAYITGSDQVWNPLFAPMDFFFDFLDDSKIRLSYAASIRINKFEKKEGKKIKELLDKFSYISVREERAVSTLRKIGVGRKIEVLPDPTFLLDMEEWNEVASTVEIDCKYIVAYLVRNKQSLVQIRKYAQEMKYKVILIEEPGYYFEEDDIFIKTKEGIGPREFIGLIKNAEFVVANSFHGAVFSIIYNKPFYVYGDSTIDDRKKTLLEKLDLEGRLVKNNFDFTKDRAIEIDFEIANKVINENRTYANNKLQSVLHDVLGNK